MLNQVGVASVDCSHVDEWGCAEFLKDPGKANLNSTLATTAGHESASEDSIYSPTSQGASLVQAAGEGASSSSVSDVTIPSDSPDAPQAPDLSRSKEGSETPHNPSTAKAFPTGVKGSSVRVSSTPVSTSSREEQPTISTTSSRVKAVSSVPPKPAADASTPTVPTEPAAAQASSGTPPPGVSSSPLGPPDFSINSTYSPTAGAQATEQVLALPETIVQDGTTFTLDQTALANGGSASKPWDQALASGSDAQLRLHRLFAIFFVCFSGLRFWNDNY